MASPLGACPECGSGEIVIHYSESEPDTPMDHACRACGHTWERERRHPGDVPAWLKEKRRRRREAVVQWIYGYQAAGCGPVTVHPSLDVSLPGQRPMPRYLVVTRNSAGLALLALSGSPEPPEMNEGWVLRQIVDLDEGRDVLEDA